MHNRDRKMVELSDTWKRVSACDVCGIETETAKQEMPQLPAKRYTIKQCFGPVACQRLRISFGPFKAKKVTV